MNFLFQKRFAPPAANNLCPYNKACTIDSECNCEIASVLKCKMVEEGDHRCIVVNTFEAGELNLLGPTSSILLSRKFQRRNLLRNCIKVTDRIIRCLN